MLNTQVRIVKGNYLIRRLRKEGRTRLKRSRMNHLTLRNYFCIKSIECSKKMMKAGTDDMITQ